MSDEVQPKAQVVPDAAAAEPTDPAQLSDQDLAQVSGGAGHQDITVSKSKSADKAATAMDGLIRG